MGGSVDSAEPWLSDIKMEEYLTITELSSRIKNYSWHNQNVQDHGRHILNGPSTFPSNTQGFAKFVQLILIAILMGWAASRFKRK